MVGMGPSFGTAHTGTLLIDQFSNMDRGGLVECR